MLRSSRFLDLISATSMIYRYLLQKDRHYKIKSQRNCQLKNLEDRNNNMEDEQDLVLVSAHPLPKIHWKLPCPETGIAQPPKQVHISPRWHMKEKGHTYLF